MKNAYDEVERERDNLKNVLQQQQDHAIKRQNELRQKMKQELQMKEQTESIYLNEIKARDKTVEELTQQVTITTCHHSETIFLCVHSFQNGTRLFKDLRKKLKIYTKRSDEFSIIKSYVLFLL